jgi:transposase-like protein
MVSHLFFSQFVLFALLWFVVLLHLIWLKRRVTARAVPAEPEPLKPQRHRSPQPQPFEGITRTPHCTLGERGTASPKTAPLVPPDPMAPTPRRPREVDPSMHFCPQSSGDYRGWLGRGHLRANGHPRGGPWRQFPCTSCNGSFLETPGTIVHGQQAAVEIIVRVLAWLAEGVGIRATARVVEVDPNTVFHWLGEAAEQLRAFAAYCLCALHVEPWQLAAVYAVWRDRKAGESSDDEAIRRLARSPSWVWTAMDPTSKLLVVVDGGSRTLAMAQRVVPQVIQVLAPDCVPLFLPDGLKDYATALLTPFGYWRHPARRHDKGPMPTPRGMPLPALRYAQVVTSYRRRRIVGGTQRVVFATQVAIEQALAACGWTINTACVERLNRDIRQRVAALGRRVNTLCQGAAGLRDQLALFQGYHNCVVPPASLRLALAAPMATNGHGAAKVWQPCTPAMAAGVTERVWSLTEVLCCRVPPWPHPHRRYPVLQEDARAAVRGHHVSTQARRCARGAENPLCGLPTG